MANPWVIEAPQPAQIYVAPEAWYFTPAEGSEFCLTADAQGEDGRLTSLARLTVGAFNLTMSRPVNFYGGRSAWTVKSYSYFTGGGADEPTVFAPMVWFTESRPAGGPDGGVRVRRLIVRTTFTPATPGAGVYQGAEQLSLAQLSTEASHV